MSLAFYTTKKIQEYISKRNAFPDDLMYAIQTFFIEKNEASKIKYVRFTLHDIIEENKYIHRSIAVEICAESLSNEIIIELNKTLAREFPSLNAFAKLHCEYE